MSSLMVSRLASICAALGLMLFARGVQAQGTFGGCVQPGAVPGALFGTIVDDAGFGFGSVSAKVCKNIVNRGVSTCRKQVKAAGRCLDQTYDSNFYISVKQCAQLPKSERKGCNDAAKSTRNAGKSDSKASQKAALSDCKADFKQALTDACNNGVM
jgi:hypothetical protein